jgi:D-inositol-3-phosphate glycosyltransferase
VKIVLVGPVYPYRGGIAHYTAGVAAALAERHAVQVISFRRLYPAWLYPGRTDKDPSQSPLDTPAEFLLDAVNPFSWRRTAERIVAERPELVVLQWWTTFLGPALGAIARACRRAGLRVVYLVHNVLPHEQRPWDRALARWALGPGSAFIVHTEPERTRLLVLLPRAAVQVVPIPVHDFFDAPGVTQAEARRRLGLPESGPILLFFGIIRPYKGLDVLLEALALLKARAAAPLLVVAGEFWGGKAATLAEIERAGLAENVRLEDRYIPNEEVGLYFTAADALAAPHLKGTQSGAATVALALGVPLVVTDRIAAGLPEGERERACVARRGDAHSLAEAISAALSQAERPAPRRGKMAGWRELAELLEAGGA